MIFAKIKPYGLEVKIKKLQSYLDEKLPWLGDKYIYGIIFNNEKKPEAFIGTGRKQTEYKQIFIDDKIACTVGFYVKDRVLTNAQVANVDIIFTVRLDKIYLNTTTRESEKALIEVSVLIRKYLGRDAIKEYKETISDVFSDFDNEQIKFRDMHPFYIFSLNIDIPYSNYLCQ